MEDEVQQRLYQFILDSFAETYRNATSEIEGVKKMIEKLEVSAPANDIMDRYISFDEEFTEAPHVVCSIYSTSSSPEIANLTCSAINATTNGCVLRVFNSGDSNRKPAITYIAVGK